MKTSRTKNIILDDTTPRIKRCQSAVVKDTTTPILSGVPRIILNDVMKMTHVQSSESSLYYKNSDKFEYIRPCTVQLSDILDFNDNHQYCSISKCNRKNCKTCDILITDTHFQSNLTTKNYNTHSHEDLNCTASNIVYGIECTLCGLIYVGETRQRLNFRMNDHRSNVNDPNNNKFLYKHFNQPDHSIVSMKVRIIEKIYHPTNDPILSTPYRLQREDFWIRELGTAIPYGCNDKIDGVGILSSPRCSTVNTLKLFNTSARRNRSHGHRKYIPPAVHTVTIDSLLSSVQKPLGIHHIRTKLYSIPLSKLSLLFQDAQNTSVTDSRSVLYRLVAIIMDIANHRLFKPVSTTSNSEEKRYFFKVEFANKV